jgi:hypothetical protein
MNNQIKAIAIVLLLSLVTSLQTSAQHLSDRYFGISEQDFTDTIKVQIWDGAIIIPVEIAGETKNLMFDTGAGMGFWIGGVEEWMRPTGDNYTIYDAQDRKKKTAIMEIPSIKMGNLTIKGYRVVVDDALSNFTCGIIDGAFGFDLVAKGISFKIDTKDSLLIMTSHHKIFANEEKGRARVKYNGHGFRPHVSTKIPFASPKMLFDMGAIGGWFGLPQDLLDRWAESNPIIKQQIEDMTVNMDTTVMTYAGLFGASYDTVINGELCIPEIIVSDIILKDVWVKTATHNMAIGSSFLEHVSLIIDAPKKSFYFIPNDGNPEIVANNKPIGLDLVPTEENDTLGGMKAIVRKGSEAYEKGIRTGDYLISTNGTPITCQCDYMLLTRHEKVKSYVFRSPEGKVKEVEW